MTTRGWIGKSTVPDADGLRKAVSKWVQPAVRIFGDPSVGPGTLRWRLGTLEWITTYDGSIARVDGGDPGDENDGE